MEIYIQHGGNFFRLSENVYSDLTYFVSPFEEVVVLGMDCS